MYQFNSMPGGNYQQLQHSAPSGYNNGQRQQIQQNPGYPHLQIPPMQQQRFHVPPHIAQSHMPQYPGFSPTHHNQAPVFNGYSGNQQQAPIHAGSYPSNPPFRSEGLGPYASSPVAPMPQQTLQHGPQAVMQSNAFQRAPQRQVSQNHAKSFAETSSDSCYNCGAPDHWAQDCPEPRRAIPAGQANRPFKRQKTHGDNVTTNHKAQQPPPPNLQRSWTGPAATQNSFLMPRNSPDLQAAQGREQRPWGHMQFQRPRMSSASSDGARANALTHQPYQGSFTQVSAGPVPPETWVQQQKHQAGNPHSAGFNHQPWSGHSLSQLHSSASPASPCDGQAWNLQQPRLDNASVTMTRVSEQSAAISHNAIAEGTPSSHAIQWPAQNLPTPAPSSIDSQIPSPDTSSLNPLDQYAQPTPRRTESPRNRHDSGSSVHKKNQDPRTQQAEIVASLFSTANLAPASKSGSLDNEVPVEESIEATEDEIEDLYGLDFPDIDFEHNITVSNPALPVAEPLSSKHEFDKTEQPQTVDASLDPASLSKHIRDVQREDFLKNVQESSDWDLLKDDPIFAKIKANTATVTFNELIERRRHMVRALTAAEEDDKEDSEEVDEEDDPQIHRHQQETEEQRLTREQEERLAALGVTGIAKPVKASSTDVPLDTPSPAEPLLTRRVSGDPGWKHYEKGRAVEHRSTNFESPSSAGKDGQSVRSAQHRSPSDFGPERHGNISPNTGRHEKEPHRKRRYSETPEEANDMLRRPNAEPKQRKPKFKQPKVAAAYG